VSGAILAGSAVSAALAGVLGALGVVLLVGAWF
jgi:hypothetical protein